MKQKGVPSDNPEMIKLHNILSAVQKAHTMSKQMKENQARQQQNGATAQENGVNGEMTRSVEWQSLI
jgi:hypothetical protein